MLSAEGYWRENILEKCVELKRKTILEKKKYDSRITETGF
jgi:hypothetical protein